MEAVPEQLFYHSRAKKEQRLDLNQGSSDYGTDVLPLYHVAVCWDSFSLIRCIKLGY